ADHLNRMACDTNVADTLPVATRADEDSTRSLYFDSLLDQNLLVRARHSVANHPGRGRSRRRAGRGIFAAEEPHPRMKPRTGVLDLACDEIEQSRVGGLEVSLRLRPLDAQRAHGGQRL